MMNRRMFLRAFSGSLVVGAGYTAHAQQNTQLRTIGWLHLGNAWPLGQFRERLREIGWIEGKSFVIETRWADNDRELLPALAADLAERRVDVIVTQTTLAALAAKDATSTIPIVMAGCNNPVREGLVTSLTHPGKNVTGVMHSPEPPLGPKLIQLLKQAAPQVSRIAVLERAVDGGTLNLSASVHDPDVVFALAQAESQLEVPTALAGALRWGANALYVPPTAVNEASLRLIADFARVHRWPSIGGSTSFPAAGGLMAYWGSWREIRRQAADYVDRILKGTKPGELPIQQPAKFDLVLNLKTAQALGLTLSPSLRLRADELIL
jgi:putative ABC transport system substrate-binding protein